MSERLPYCVSLTEETELVDSYGHPVHTYPEGYVVGNFADEKFATTIFNNLGIEISVQDTRPAPKIPDNASVISYWVGESRFLASRYGNPVNKVWAWGGVGDDNISQEDLLVHIGDATVTVLEEL